MSKFVTLHGFGGGGGADLNFEIVGGADLNFEIVGGTTEPANPTENMIWVNTSTDIHTWDFSVTEPIRRSNNKNLIIYPFKDTTKTTNGITFTDNRNGTITAKGTATADAYFNMSDFGASYGELTLEPGTYVLSKSTSASGISLAMIYTYSDLDHGEPFFYVDGGTSSKSITIAKKARAMLMLVIKSGTTVSSITIKPQLEKGSTATSFVKGDATGQVWITTGTSSQVAFDSLKGDITMMTYPVSAKQYVNGAWTYMDAYMFKNDGWVQFDFAVTCLFENGNLCKNITGGWSKSGYTISDFNSGSDNSKVTIGDSIVCQAVSGSSVDYAGACGTVNKINKDGFTKLRVKGNVSGYNSNARFYVGVNTSKSLNATPTAKISLTANGDFEKTLTLPNVASFYVFVLAACYTGVANQYTATLTVDSIKLE